MIDQRMLASILSGVGKGLLAPPVAGQSNLQAAGQGLAGSLEQDMLRRQQEQAQKEALAREDALRKQQFSREDALNEIKHGFEKDRIRISGINADTNKGHLERSRRRDEVLDERWKEEFGFKKSKFQAENAHRAAQRDAARQAKTVAMEGIPQFLERVSSSKNPYAIAAAKELEINPSAAKDVRAQYAKKIASLPGEKRRADRAVQTMESKFEKNIGQLNRLDELTEEFATNGFSGFVSSFIAGTNAYDAESVLTSILSRFGFEELAKMRRESKTGGALGQVTVREIELLQSTIGSMRLGQSKEQFKESLASVFQTLKKMRNDTLAAYQQDLNEGYLGEQYMLQQPVPQQAPQAPQAPQGPAAPPVQGMDQGFKVISG